MRAIQRFFWIACAFGARLVCQAVKFYGDCPGQNDCPYPYCPNSAACDYAGCETPRYCAV